VRLLQLNPIYLISKKEITNFCVVARTTEQLTNYLEVWYLETNQIFIILA